MKFRGTAAAVALCVAILVCGSCGTDGSKPVGTDKADTGITSVAQEEITVDGANETALHIFQTINRYLTAADAHGYGMDKASSGTSRLEIAINDGTWDLMLFGTENFKSKDDIKWMPNGTGYEDKSKLDENNVTSLLGIELARTFPKVTGGTVRAMLCAGECVCLAYTDDASAILAESTDIPGMTGNGWASDTFAWDGKTAGVTPDGLIVGTYPEVGLE